MGFRGQPETSKTVAGQEQRAQYHPEARQRMIESQTPNNYRRTLPRYVLPTSALPDAAALHMDPTEFSDFKKMLFFVNPKKKTFSRQVIIFVRNFSYFIQRCNFLFVHEHVQMFRVQRNTVMCINVVLRRHGTATYKDCRTLDASVWARSSEALPKLLCAIRITSATIRTRCVKVK